MNVWIFTASLFLLACLTSSMGEEDDLTGTVRFKRSPSAPVSAGPPEVLFKFRVKRQFGGFSNERYDSGERRFVSHRRRNSRERHSSRDRFVSRENSKEFTLASLVPALSDLSSSESEIFGLAMIKGVVIKILAAVFLGMQALTNSNDDTST